MRASVKWIALAATAVVLIMPLIATYFVPVWSRGRFELDPVLFGLLLGAAWLSSLAQVPNILVVSFSRHDVLARWFLLSAVLAIGLTALLSRHVGELGVALAAIVAEALVLAISVREANRCLHAHRARA